MALTARQGGLGWPVGSEDDIETAKKSGLSNEATDANLILLAHTRPWFNEAQFHDTQSHFPLIFPPLSPKPLSPISCYGIFRQKPLSIPALCPNYSTPRKG